MFVFDKKVILFVLTSPESSHKVIFIYTIAKSNYRYGSYYLLPIKFEIEIWKPMLYTVYSDGYYCFFFETSYLLLFVSDSILLKRLIVSTALRTIVWTTDAMLESVVIMPKTYGVWADKNI